MIYELKKKRKKKIKKRREKEKKRKRKEKQKKSKREEKKANREVDLHIIHPDKYNYEIAL